MASTQTQSKISVKGTEITVLSKDAEDDFISLTDIAKYKNPTEAFIVINNWMRLRNTIEYLGIWEQLNNPNFKPIEFDRFMHEAGANAFTLSPQKWIASTNAVGLVSKSGRYGGTYAHKDIAFKFASWISIEFELYVIKDYQRLKQNEQKSLSLEWNLQRTLAKINYRIHTDAIKAHIIPHVVTEKQSSFVYADEADLLNVAIFGKTAAEWRAENSKAKGNIRDEATLAQLVVLSNIESINALLISEGLPQKERLLRLNAVAITQLRSLLAHDSMKQLELADKK